MKKLQNNWDRNAIIYRDNFMKSITALNGAQWMESVELFLQIRSNFYSKIGRVKIVADVFLHETNFIYLKKRVNFHIPNLSLLLNSLFTVKIWINFGC